MRLTNVFLIISVLFYLVSANAQQDTHYTLYRYNMNLVNPAFAGVDNETILGINFRSQWSGVMGAPETQSAFFSSPLGNKVGMGVSIINDRTFIEDQTSIMADFSYHLNLNESTNLYLGLKTGAHSYNANTDGLTTFSLAGDPSLTNLGGSFKFNVGVGALIKGNKYFVALSAPKILTPDRLEYNDDELKLAEDRLHSYLAAGYDIELGGGLILKPSAILKYVNASPISLDLTTTLLFKKRFEIGGAYRLNEGIAGMLICDVANWLDLGYAYISEFENDINNVSNGSHEVFINFNL